MVTQVTVKGKVAKTVAVHQLNIGDWLEYNGYLYIKLPLPHDGGSVREIMRVETGVVDHVNETTLVLHIPRVKVEVVNE